MISPGRRGICLCVLLLLLAGLAPTHAQYIASDTVRRVAVCLTPKLSCSQHLDFLHSRVGGLPGGCRYLDAGYPGCLLPAALTVSRYHPMHRVGPLFVAAFPNPSSFKNLSRKEVFTTFDTLAVVYRDPWSRLLSAFRDKFQVESRGVPAAFRRDWLQGYSLDAGQDVLVRYFEAVLGTRVGDLNEHFGRQVDMCLHHRVLARPLSNYSVAGAGMESGLDAVSALFGFTGTQSFYALYGHAPSPRPGSVHEVSAGLLRRVYAFLRADYDKLCALFPPTACYPRIPHYRNVSDDTVVLVDVGTGALMPKADCRADASLSMCQRQGQGQGQGVVGSGRNITRENMIKNMIKNFKMNKKTGETEMK
jgi:hypothetical protein